MFTVDTEEGQPAIRVSREGSGTITTTDTFPNCHLRLRTESAELSYQNMGVQPISEITVDFKEC